MILMLLTALPIATLIFGQFYKKDCPIQSMIPQWMWIFSLHGMKLEFFIMKINIFIYRVVCFYHVVLRNVIVDIILVFLFFVF